MADSASQNYFTANVLTNTGYALIIVTTATVITRFSIRIWKRKPFEIEDLLVGLAWASFLALTISYIVITPPMYHLYAVTGGEAEPYPEMMDDALVIIKVFFYSTMLLWCTLWAVKFSLLALYRRLMTGLRAYIILWWALVVFCALVSPPPCPGPAVLMLPTPDLRRGHNLQSHILQQHARLVHSRFVLIPTPTIALSNIHRPLRHPPRYQRPNRQPLLRLRRRRIDRHPEYNDPISRLLYHLI